MTTPGVTPRDHRGAARGVGSAAPAEAERVTFENQGALSLGTRR
jgi:hypothetical protein